MKIDRIEATPRELPRKEPFATSQHVSEAASVVFVRVDADGMEGWGAASPSDVTGETMETVSRAIAKLAGDLKGVSFDRGREVAEMKRLFHPAGRQNEKGAKQKQHRRIEHE